MTKLDNIICELCWIEFKARSGRQKYCFKCWVVIQKERTKQHNKKERDKRIERKKRLDIE